MLSFSVLSMMSLFGRNVSSPSFSVKYLLECQLLHSAKFVEVHCSIIQTAETKGCIKCSDVVLET